MTAVRVIDLTWIALIGLTVLGVALGEGASPNLAISLVVATITAIKGRLLIDRFLELGGAHPGIRRTVRTFGLLVPVLIVIVHLFGDRIASLTTL
jgi:hypothetical protein